MKSIFNSLTNLQQRLISALGGLLVLVGAVLAGQYSFFLLILLLNVFGTLEFYRLIGRRDGIRPRKLAGVSTVALVTCLTFATTKEWVGERTFFACALPYFLLFFQELYRPTQHPFLNIAVTLFALLYVCIPFTSLLWLSLGPNQTYSPGTILGILALLFLSDTGAYFAGRLWGRTPLFPRHSPKKTWEGTLGGAVLAVMGGGLMVVLVPTKLPYEWVAYSVIMVVAGTYGDLAESMLKRSLAIKDSGGLIPGHGGILDRFDGFLLASPALLLFEWVNLFFTA